MIRAGFARCGLALAAILLAAFAQPVVAQGRLDESLTVPAHLKDLDSSWRRVTVRLSQTSPPSSPMALSMSALSGGDQPKVYYTRGRTVEWAGRTFLVACRPPDKPLNPAAFQGLERPDQIIDALVPAPKPDDPLETALIPLDAIAGIESVQPFDLQQATHDRAGLSSPTMTLAAILFPVFAQARVTARETSSVSNLRQIATAAMMYTQDWDEVLPPMKDAATAKKALMPYCKNEAMFIDPRTNEPYHVNVAASRKHVATVDSPAQFVLFYEATPGRDGKRAVAFLDGHVKRITEQEWETAKRKSGMQ